MGSSPSRDEFVHAVKFDHVDEVKQFLNKNFNKDEDKDATDNLQNFLFERDDFTNTPLDYACINTFGSDEMAEIILSKMIINNEQDVLKANLLKKSSSNFNCTLEKVVRSGSVHKTKLVIRKIIEAGGRSRLQEQLVKKDLYASALNTHDRFKEDGKPQQMILFYSALLFYMGGSNVFGVMYRLAVDDINEYKSHLQDAGIQNSSWTPAPALLAEVKELMEGSKVSTAVAETASDHFATLVALVEDKHVSETQKLQRINDLFQKLSSNYMRDLFRMSDRQTLLMHICSNCSSQVDKTTPPQLVKLVLDKIVEAGGIIEPDLLKNQLTAVDFMEKNCLMMVCSNASSVDTVKIIAQKIVEVAGAVELEHQLAAADARGFNCLMFVANNDHDATEPIMKFIATLLVHFDLFKKQFNQLSAGFKTMFEAFADINDASWIPDPKSVAEAGKIFEKDADVQKLARQFLMKNMMQQQQTSKGSNTTSSDNNIEKKEKNMSIPRKVSDASLSSDDLEAELEELELESKKQDAINTNNTHNKHSTAASSSSSSENKTPQKTHQPAATGTTTAVSHATSNNNSNSKATTAAQQQKQTSSSSSPNDHQKKQEQDTSVYSVDSIPPARCFKRGVPDKNLEGAINSLFSIKEAPSNRPDLKNWIPDKEDASDLLHYLNHSLPELKKRPVIQKLIAENHLTDDDIKILHSYKVQHPYPVYLWLNGWLGGDRRDDFVKEHVAPFFVLLYRAMEKLPRVKTVADRAIKVNGIASLKNTFENFKVACAPKSTLSFWGFSSFSTADDVVNREEFVGKLSEPAIVYSCGELEGVDMEPFAPKGLKSESEILPLCPCVLEVQTAVKIGQKLIVGVKQLDHASFSYVAPH